MGIEGHGLPFCGQHERPFASGPRLPFVQQMNLSPCWIYDVKSAVSDQNNRKSAFFLEYPVLGSLCEPIINNTITKTRFLSHSFISGEGNFSVLSSLCVLIQGSTQNIMPYDFLVFGTLQRA